jgi:hypothetical protein
VTGPVGINLRTSSPSAAAVAAQGSIGLPSVDCGRSWQVPTPQGHADVEVRRGKRWQRGVELNARWAKHTAVVFRPRLRPGRWCVFLSANPETGKAEVVSCRVSHQPFAPRSELRRGGRTPRLSHSDLVRNTLLQPTRAPTRSALPLSADRAARSFSPPPPPRDPLFLLSGSRNTRL